MTVKEKYNVSGKSVNRLAYLTEMSVVKVSCNLRFMDKKTKAKIGHNSKNNIMLMKTRMKILSICRTL